MNYEVTSKTLRIEANAAHVVIETNKTLILWLERNSTLTC